MAYVKAWSFKYRGKHGISNRYTYLVQRGFNGNVLKVFFKRQECRSGWKIDLMTIFLNRSANKHGGYIGKGAWFASRPRLPHGLHGIFISRYAHIGKECWIYQNVTIGEVHGKAPTIGDDCLIGAGAILVGDITIGDGAKIGAGAIVRQDIPAGAIVTSQPPQIYIHKSKTR